MISAKRKLYKKAGASTLLSKETVVVVIAILCIAALLLVAATLWSAIFPGPDKTAIKGFDQFSSLVNTRLSLNTDYTSSTIGVYLPSDYKIIFFDSKKEDPVYCGGTKIYIPEVDECKETPCMCLYEDDPSGKPDDRNDELVKCASLKYQFEVLDFEFYDSDCDSKGGTFFEAIVAKQKADKSPISYLYIWQNTAENKKKDAEFRKPICQNKDQSHLCYNRKADSMTIALDAVTLGAGFPDQELYSKRIPLYQNTFSACKTTASKEIFEAKCIYDQTTKECSLDCSGDSLGCGTKVKKCEDYNTGDFILFGSPDYYACEYNKNICNVNKGKCYINPSIHYSCRKGMESDCNRLLDGTMPPYGDVMGVCKLIIGNYSAYTPVDPNNPQLQKTNNRAIFARGDILDYENLEFMNSRGEIFKCKDVLEKYFRKTEVMICRPGQNCLSFIRQDAPAFVTDCEMELGTYSQITLMNYKSEDAECVKQVENYFMPIMQCSSNPDTRFK